MTDIDALRRDLERIDAEIEDTESRMPAHSVKPPIMHALFDLEERREQIVAELKRLGDAEAG
jgi:hypothetical protein